MAGIGHSESRSLIEEIMAMVGSKDGKSRTMGVVTRVEADGTVWARVSGSNIETPCERSATAVRPGDVVAVSVENGRGTVESNFSRPATDDTRANEAARSASSAQQTADMARDMAETSIADAQLARAAAESAVADAASAEASAADASSAASTAQTMASSASAAAAAAQQTADGIAATAQQAASDAASALASANTASAAAAGATMNLSEVERVVGTLNWIAQHGSYELSGDSTVDPSKVYYERTGSGTAQDPYVYTVVADPQDSEVAGYYVLVIDESVQNYLASHLAQTNYGLNLMVDNSLFKAHIGTIDGNHQMGLHVIDVLGNVVATFGQEAVIGQEADGYVKVTEEGIVLGNGDLEPFEVRLEDVLHTQIEEECVHGYVLTSGSNLSVQFNRSDRVTWVGEVGLYYGTVMEAQGSDPTGYSVAMAVDDENDLWDTAENDLPTWCSLSEGDETVDYEGGQMVTVNTMKLTVDTSDPEVAAFIAGADPNNDKHPKIMFCYRYITSLLGSGENEVGLAVRVGGRGTLPVYKYNRKPTESSIPSKPSIVTCDDGSMWLATSETMTEINGKVKGVKGDAESSYRTGDVNLTPANIGAVNLAGDTMTGVLHATALHVGGRVYGSGDDEGLLVTPAPNGISGLILGSHNARRSVFYLRSSGAPTWTYNDGSSAYTLTHPAKTGTIEVVGHTHNYAGSSSAGGRANEAAKVYGIYTGSGGKQGPGYYGKNYAGFLMSNETVNGDSHYKNWLYMDCYSGTDVGGTTALGLDRNEPRAFLMQSDANRSSWNNKAEVITTFNRRTVLYNNASGTNGTVSLSASAANYNHMRIYFNVDSTSITGNSPLSSVDVYSPNGKVVSLPAVRYSGSTSSFVYSVVTISGTSISVNGRYYMNIQGSACGAGGTTTGAYIKRVEAWNE